MSESCLILLVDPDEFTRLPSSEDAAIGKLFRRLLTHTRPLPSVTAICPRNPNLCLDTFLECSLTIIRSSSILPVEVAQLSEQQKALARNMLSALTSMLSTLNEPTLLLGPPDNSGAPRSEIEGSVERVSTQA